MSKVIMREVKDILVEENDLLDQIINHSDTVSVVKWRIDKFGQKRPIVITTAGALRSMRKAEGKRARIPEWCGSGQLIAVEGIVSLYVHKKMGIEMIPTVWH